MPPSITIYPPLPSATSPHPHFHLVITILVSVCEVVVVVFDKSLKKQYVSFLCSVSSPFDVSTVLMKKWWLEEASECSTLQSNLSHALPTFGRLAKVGPFSILPTLFTPHNFLFKYCPSSLKLEYMRA